MSVAILAQQLLTKAVGTSVAFLHAHMVTLRPAARQGRAQRLEEQGHAQLSPYAVEMCKLLGFEEPVCVQNMLAKMHARVLAPHAVEGGHCPSRLQARKDASGEY